MDVRYLLRLYVSVLSGMHLNLIHRDISLAQDFDFFNLKKYCRCVVMWVRMPLATCVEDMEDTSPSL